MSEPHDESATLTDDDIETHRVGVADAGPSADTADTGDDTDDSSALR